MDLDLQSNLPALCRVCMEITTSSKSDNIYSSLLDPRESNLYTMLSAICSPVFSKENSCYGNYKESSLEMPRNICLKCKQDVVSAYELHLRCIETDRKLHELMMLKHAREDSEMKFLKVFIKPPPVEQDVGKQENFVDSSSESEIFEPYEDDTDDDYKEPIAQKQRKRTKATNISVKNEEAPKKPNVEPMASSNEIVQKGLARSSTSSKKKAKKPVLSIKCKLCPEIFDACKFLQQHITVAHTDTIVVCNSCKLAFSSKEQFDRHMESHKAGHSYSCEFCNITYKVSYKLSVHLEYNKIVGPIPCPECTKIVMNKTALKYHIANCHAEKTFACERCPLRFTSKPKVIKHMLTHTREKNHICDICGARFCLNDTLKAHIKNIHEQERNHNCATCGMKFYSATLLKRHMRTHTGEKPYKCAYCDRAYAQSNDLVKHSKIHVGENPYSCDRCDACFRLITELRNHYKVHFQPNDQTQGASTAALLQQYEKVEVKTMFTSEATLNRRFELDRQRMDF